MLRIIYLSDHSILLSITVFNVLKLKIELGLRLLLSLPVWRVETTWRPSERLPAVADHREHGARLVLEPWRWGELGRAWVAVQRAGPPWLAPVILPSHSSARDINNNSTSGFTLLSHFNSFCNSRCYHCCPSPLYTPPPLLSGSLSLPSSPFSLLCSWVWPRQERSSYLNLITGKPAKDRLRRLLLSKQMSFHWYILQS
jgi:hypothetical protein